MLYEVITDLVRQLRTEMDSVGSELGQSMKQILQALEQRNGTSAEGILSRLDDLRNREDCLKDRITSYNVCYTKLLRSAGGGVVDDPAVFC